MASPGPSASTPSPDGRHFTKREVRPGGHHEVESSVPAEHVAGDFRRATGAELCLLAVLWRDDPHRAAVIRALPRIAVGSAIVVGAVFVIRCGFQENYLGVQLFGHTPTILLCAWLLGGRSSQAEAHSRVGSAAWSGQVQLRHVLFHWPIHIAVAPVAEGLVNAGPPMRRLLAFLIYAVVVGAPSLAGATISWAVLESSFLRLKDRLAPRAA
jgi:hypothetical protein